MDEYERFATLHGYQENQQAEHFQVVLKAVGVERLQNYHDDLEEILSKLKPPDTKQEDVISRWANFFQGYKRSFAKLKKILNLTDAIMRIKSSNLSSSLTSFDSPPRKKTLECRKKRCLPESKLFTSQTANALGSFTASRELYLSNRSQCFSRLLELRVYLTKLENIVELKPPDTKHEDVISQWAKFFQGYEGSFARLKEILKLTDADHESQIKQLVELAHFIRFPMEKEPSERLLEEMLTRIQQSDKKSRKSQQQSTAFKRFEKLHGYGKDEVAGKFIAIVEAAGVARLQKYHEELQSLMHSFNDDLSACRI
ncbi:hypothetical protein PGT21_000087 [Puccinia graminis f. sp. tritici]|nr:hypothetical protein PGT21_000087 [Puccinia graminis f. sp. tritici]